MGETRFLYPEDMLPHVLGAWDKARDVATRHSEGLLPPALLTSLLTTAYHASMETEESRKLQFRLIAFHRGENDQLQPGFDLNPRYVHVRFPKPRPLSVAELIRLAPATDPSHTLIAVRPAEDKQSLEIWGLTSFSNEWTINADLIKQDEAPPYVVVKSERPGNIEVACGSAVLLRFAGGEVVKSSGSIMGSGPIHDFFKPEIDSFQSDVAARSVKGSRELREGLIERAKDDYTSVFAEIVTQIRRQDHGGTVIVLPTDYSADDPRIRDHIHVKYPTENLAMRDSLLAFTHLVWTVMTANSPQSSVGNNIGDEIRNITHAHESLRQALDVFRRSTNFVAGLANVDGAVVMTSDLRVLGFGAEILARSSLSKMLRANDPDVSSSSEIDVTAFGTRHRSAFRLSANVQDAVSFVVSQDGGCRVFKRVKRDVVIWSDPTINTVYRDTARRESLRRMLEEHNQLLKAQAEARKRLSGARE